MLGYLYRREGTYWFRRRVPQNLVVRLGITEVRRSLRTSSIRLARARSVSAWAASSRAFEQMNLVPQLQAAQAKALIDQLLSESIIGSPTAIAISQSLVKDDGWAMAMLTEELVEATASLPYNEGHHVAVQVDWAVTNAEATVARRAAAYAWAEVEQAKVELAKLAQKLAESEKSQLAAEINLRISEGMRPAPGHHDSQLLITRESGTVNLEAPTALPAPKARAKSKSIRLSEAEKPFLDEKTRHGGYTGQTVAQTKATIRLLASLIADKPLVDYTGEEAGRFRDLLLRMPASHGKGRYVPPLQAIEQADRQEQETGTPVPRLAMKTAKRHFSTLNQLWKWAKPRGYVESFVFLGFQFPQPKRKRAARSDWPDSGLKALLASTLFADDTPWDSADRWLPIISLYSGMRLEEISRLRPAEDFEVIDGNWVFQVQPHPDGWTPKTEAGERAVPVHPVLIECGLIKLVEARRAANAKRMWLDLTASGPDKKYGAAFSRKFGKLKDALGIARNVTFHSFRHNVETILRNTLTPDTWIDAVIGHEPGEGKSVGASVYLKRIDIENLRTAVERIAYVREVTDMVKERFGAGVDQSGSP